MKTTLHLFVFILLSLFCADASAQLYRVESLVNNVIFTKDKPAKVIDRSNEKGYRIPNGTEIKVLSRVVEDTLSSRGILAKIEYKGKQYYTEARWLVFSENNGEGVQDLFADDDFSPAPPELMGISLVKLDPHSSFGRFLYGNIPPILSAALLLAAIILLLISSKLFLPGLLFLLSAGIQVYLSAMLDWETFWWCNPAYYGLTESMLRVLPLGLYLILQFGFIVFFYASGDDNMKAWPIVAGYLLTFPAGLLSVSITGVFWIGAALCYLIPLLINLVKAGIKGAVITVFLFIAISIVFGTLTSLFQVSLWLLAELIVVCPAVLYLLSLIIGPLFDDRSLATIERESQLTQEKMFRRRKRENSPY